MIMLSVLDSQWKDHLLSMDHLKEGIGLRGYGQHDPLVEYKKESFRYVRSDAAALSGRHGPVSLLDADYRASAGFWAEWPARRWTRGPGSEPGVPVQGSGGNGHHPPRLVATSADDLEEAFMRRKRRELEQARMAGAGDALPVQQVVRDRRKLAATIPAPAARERNLRSATERRHGVERHLLRRIFALLFSTRKTASRSSS